MKELGPTQLKFGPQAATNDQGRILQSLADNPYDGDPPRNRKMMENPTWRVHEPHNWVKPGQRFLLGSKSSYFKTEQVWPTVPVYLDGQNRDIYEDGLDAIGNERRTRQKDKEIVKIGVTPIQEKRTVMLKSVSHRSLDQEQFVLKFQKMQNQIDDQKEREKQSRAVLSNVRSPVSQSVDLDAVVEDFSEINGNERFATQFSDDSSRVTWQKRPISSTNNSKRPQSSSKFYFKSMEAHMQFGYLKSSKAQNDNLFETNRVQTNSILQKYSSRPMTAFSTNKLQKPPQIKTKLARPTSAAALSDYFDKPSDRGSEKKNVIGVSYANQMSYRPTSTKVKLEL